MNKQEYIDSTITKAEAFICKVKSTELPEIENKNELIATLEDNAVRDTLFKLLVDESANTKKFTAGNIYNLTIETNKYNPIAWVTLAGIALIDMAQSDEDSAEFVAAGNAFMAAIDAANEADTTPTLLRLFNHFIDNEMPPSLWLDSLKKISLETTASQGHK